MSKQFKVLSLCVCVGLLNVAAFGQEPPPDLLSGPTIETEEVTEKDMLERHMNEQGKDVKINDRALVGLWIKTMESMDLESVQRTEFRDAISEYQIAQKTYRDTYGKELTEIRRRTAENKSMTNQDRTMTSKRASELMGMAPDVTVYQERVWVLLSSDQQATFRDSYQTLIEQAKKDKSERTKGNRPTRDGKRGEGFAPRDSRFRNQDVDPMDDPIDRHGDALDESSLKRIKFLRRLQNLKKD